MDEPPNRIRMAIVCLHVSSILYVLFAIVFPLLFFLMPEDDTPPAFRIVLAVLLGGIGLVCAIGAEVVAWGLGRRRYWAWIAGLCVFGLYTPSLFLPLGVLGLWGLLDSGSQEVFQAVRKVGGKP